MNTLTFLNSPLLWGLAAASIPILIHLLFRRQYRRVDWAPMRYLKLSIQRNRRRVRLEQILLLLLRTAMVLLLFFLLARPVMHAQGLSQWLGGNSRTNRVVVLDDSLSMGYAQQASAAIARARDVLAEVLPTFGAQDRLTVVLASQPAEPLLREVELGQLDDHLRVIRAAEPVDVFVGWQTVFEAVDKLIAGGSYPLHEVTLVTDLRRPGWEDSLAELANRWAGQKITLRVFDVGSTASENVVLENLQQVDRLAMVGSVTRFEAQVRNDTQGELGALEANFVVDGRPTLVRIAPIGPGQTARVPLSAVFQEPGTHDVAFQLPDDALRADNNRWCTVDVLPGVDIQLIDGEPSSEPLGGETDFLGLAMSLSDDAVEAFHVEVLTDSQWASAPSTHPDLLVLANVPHLSSQQVEQLERDVAAGAGLMIFVGDQVDPDNYNQLLYKDGTGLLPAPLESIADNEFSGLLVDPAENSPLAALSQLTPAALARIKVRRIYDVRMPATDVEGTHVLARWNNAAASPAIVERVFGDGRVLLWTTAADRSWSDWPTEASYVLAVREAARAIAKSTASLRQYTAGQSLRVELPASHDITLPAVRMPGADQPLPLTVTAASDKSKPDSSEPARELLVNSARRAGVYSMNWNDSVSGAMSQAFAVNPDPRESNLERLSGDEFKKLWGVLAPELISVGTRTDASLAVHGREIWRTLATGLLGLLVVEACFARWAGRQR